MLRVNNNLYPLGNIKNVSIVDDGLSFSLTYYFKEDTKLRPVTETFISSKDLNKKLELISVSKPSRLLG